MTPMGADATSTTKPSGDVIVKDPPALTPEEAKKKKTTRLIIFAVVAVVVLAVMGVFIWLALSMDVPFIPVDPADCENDNPDKD